MTEGFELRLEIPIIAPDTPETIGSHVRRAVLEAEVESGLPEQPPVFAQGLPTKEGIALVTAVLALVKTGLETWPVIHKFLHSLAARLDDDLPVKMNAEVRIGGKVIKAKRLSPGDAIRVISDECEVHFQSLRQE